MVTWVASGILLNRLRAAEPIPVGCTTWDGEEQFCTNEESLQMKTITFLVDDLVWATLHMEGCCGVLQL